jgi:NAD+ diphosphatase
MKPSDVRPPLARGVVSRADERREDAQWQQETWVKALVLDLNASGDELVINPALEYGTRPPAHAIFLGTHEEKVYWSVGNEDIGRAYAGFRVLAMSLDDVEANLFTAAIGLFNWHAYAGFCAKCGAATKSSRSGWARDCTGCGRQEYPRTDPAVIVLVHDGADQVLLGRGAQWPEGRYSVLAGFTEAGESLESTVVREIAEEVGIDVTDVQYMASQPWPFPRSLMLGYIAQADPSQQISLADGEIADAFWATKTQVREILDAGGTLGDLTLPGGTSIAFALLDAWSSSSGQSPIE